MYVASKAGGYLNSFLANVSIYYTLKTAKNLSFSVFRMCEMEKLSRNGLTGTSYTKRNTVWKVSKYINVPGPYIPIFGLNTEIYGGNLRIHSKNEKIRNRKNSVFWYFSRSESYL